MRLDGNWGGEQELVSWCRIRKRSVRVFSWSQQQKTLIEHVHRHPEDEGDEDVDQDMVNMLHLDHHYWYLRR